MGRWGIVSLLLVGVISVRCASARSVGVAGGVKHGVATYTLDDWTLNTVDVHQGVQGTPQFRLKAASDAIWVMRVTGHNTDFAVFAGDGQARVPFTPLPAVSLAFDPFFEPSWLPAGDRLLVWRGEYNPLGKSTAKIMQVYPEPQKEVAVDPAQIRRLVAASENGVYVTDENAQVLTELDRDLHPKETYPVKGAAQAVPIGKGQLLVGRALYDLGTKDFMWDDAGVAPKSLAPNLDTWGAVTSDPSGVVWFASIRDGGRSLRLVASDRNGKLLVDKVIEPRDFDLAAGLAMTATEKNLIVGAIGYYKGERKLLLYTFGRK